MKSELLRLKHDNYNELVEKAARLVGLNVNAFMRMASVKEAKKVLLDSTHQGVEKS